MKIASINLGNNYELIGKMEVATEADVIRTIEDDRKAQTGWTTLPLKNGSLNFGSDREIS